MKEIRLSEWIGEGFYDIHRDIREGRHTHYWLKGGRGSGKSSFLSLEILLGLIADRDANAVVLRKVAANLRDSVFEQMNWAIHALGVEEEWEKKISPMELIRKGTGQKILFRGCDDPKKLKSIKFQRGYAKFIWYEEADEFGGMAELRSLNQSLLRGGEEFRIFYSYNPPKQGRSWINLETAEERADRLIHHSTYLQMKEEWLGKQFLAEAEYIRKRHPEIYRHEYLGEVTGSGGEVFRNLMLREITDVEIAAFDRLRRGLDWGYAVDPLHYTVNHYDRTRRRLYIFYELRAQGMKLNGPLPADTLFQPKYLDNADAVLAMYHDQGLPVLKYQGFGRGVNITLGLPFIRTSVDHGTALELAGRGEADVGSFITALNLAIKMIVNTQ